MPRLTVQIASMYEKKKKKKTIHQVKLHNAGFGETTHNMAYKKKKKKKAAPNNPC